jgi:hypothetical protein
MVLRQQAELGADDRLDPFASKSKFGLEIAYVDGVEEFAAEDRVAVSRYDAKVWSGIGRALPTGGLLVMLNRNQTIQRMNVTVMEEVAHVHYGHKETSLSRRGRSKYNAADEREAYQTAAAALLPSLTVARAVYTGVSAKDLASKYGASIELVEMRIKLLQLWPQYRQR